MIKKIWYIFSRDAKVSFRDFISAYIIIIPIVLAIAVNFFAPGIEDTTVNIAVIKGENVKRADYLEDFAHIERLDSYEDVEKRVLKRDNIVGIVGNGEDSYILSQGDEPEEVLNYTKHLKVFFEKGRKIEDSTAKIIDFGVKIPPLKRLWCNMGIILTTLLAGMLISLNIVEEKMDNTVSAINVTPVSRKAFILGKCMIGVLLALIGSIAMVMIMGLWSINFAQLIVLIFASILISLMVGFIQGVKSDDVMTAVAGVKMIMLPMAASIAGYQFLSQKWQWILYWSPFYWAYKGNAAVLSGDATWGQVLLYTGIILVISIAVFIYLAPKIRKGLEK